MNLKDIINQVLSQSTFLTKVSFTNSNDPDDVQMVSIANRTAYEIMNFYAWMELRVPYELGLNPEQSIYELPNDYHMIMPDSVWESDGSRKVDIPVPDGRWYQYKFSSMTDAGIIRARIYGTSIQINDPGDTESISMEYISKWPIRSMTGEAKELFDNDNDTFILDDQLLILGLQANWAQAKKLPQTDQWMGNYMSKMNEAIGRQTGGQTVGGLTRPVRFGPYYPLWQNSSGS